MNILYTGQSALRSICTTGYDSAYVTPWYSSQYATARDVEQLFTQQHEPWPSSDDWENFIIPITAGDYVAARYRMYITAINTTFPHIGMTSPLFRMCTSAGEISAYFPRDGYNIDRGYTSTSMPWPTAKYKLQILESSVSPSPSGDSARVVASAASPWIPMSELAGTYTGECSACVGCRANPSFISTWRIYNETAWRSAFLDGTFTALPESAAISGQVQFARTGADWGYQVSDMLVR